MLTVTTTLPCSPTPPRHLPPFLHTLSVGRSDQKDKVCAWFGFAASGTSDWPQSKLSEPYIQGLGTDPGNAAPMYAILLPELDKRQTRLVIHVSKKLARVLACSAVCIQMAPTTTFTSPNIIHASLVTITLCSKRSDLHLDVVSNSEKRVLNMRIADA